MSTLSSNTTLPLSRPTVTNNAKPLWDLTPPEIERWIRSLSPGVANTGGMLFPKFPDDDAEKQAYQNRVALGNLLLKNLLSSLSMASDTTEKNGNGDERNPKRQRLEHQQGDVNGILDPSFSKQSNNTVAEGEGAILSRLTLGGLVNGLAGIEGGVVDTVTCVPLCDLDSNGDNGRVGEKKSGVDQILESAGNLTLKQLIKIGSGLHRSVSARTEMDVMSTTPRRIADLFCPEISMAELNNIRRRIHDTVVLGMGTHSSAQAASLEEEEKEIPVAKRLGRSEVEQWQRCNTCNNNDQSSFILDRKNGDLICTSCGTVVSESIMHEGSQYRKFEGEEDRNHHGDAPNPLFSDSHNMSTTLGGVSFQPGAGMGGYGSGGKRNIENILRNAHAYTEMNISQFGKDEKKTRIGYKDRQKKDAFYQMAHAGDALGLHEAVVQRAKELFAGFRDDREMVQQFKGVLAACLCEAFDQLSRDGRRILKRRAGEVDDGNSGNDGEDDEGQAKVLNARASRRNDLHSASLAGKGGLLLDTTAVSHGGIGGGALSTTTTTQSTTGQPFESKTAATWDLDDCRSWMMEASKSIARTWSESQQSAIDKSYSIDSKESNNILKGTRDELEGKLVEDTLKLCEFLESELNAALSNGKSSLMGNHQRVRTPRVDDMAQLGIKWQHSYERGSGGKGGVGNSGTPGQTPQRGKTAGQILLLLTAKKFGTILQDMVAGAAFHKELKALIGREDAIKRHERRVEATQARLKQMNRKPWLQKRVM